MNRFQTLFAKKSHCFMPFFMLGYPDIASCFDYIKAAIDAGADALELGLPFSDPVADGPVIEHSARAALAGGADFKACCQLIEKIRAYSDIPIGLLVYYNVIFQQGEAVYQTLKSAGVDAILAVDLPLEESSQHEALLKQADLGSVFLIAPNTPNDRAKIALEKSTAFAYVVSRFGTTGTTERLSETLGARIQTLKTGSNCPLVVGFGISDAAQVKTIFESGANGAIIGSQMTKFITEHLSEKEKALHLIQQLTKACIA